MLSAIRRPIFTALLTLVHALTLCRVFVPYLHYAFDKDFYAEQCENKAKPELECNGCCQVRKEVASEAAAAHENEQSSKSQTPTRSTRANVSEAPVEPADAPHTSPALCCPQTGSTIFAALDNSSLLPGDKTLPFHPPRA